MERLWSGATLCHRHESYPHARRIPFPLFADCGKTGTYPLASRALPLLAHRCPGPSTGGGGYCGKHQKLLPSAPHFGLDGRDPDRGGTGGGGAVPVLPGAGTCLSADPQSQAAHARARCHRRRAGHRALYGGRPGAFRNHRPALPGDGGALRFRAGAGDRSLPVLSRRAIAPPGGRAACDERGIFRAHRSAQFHHGSR